MKKWLLLLLIPITFGAEAAVSLPYKSIGLKTDVTVKISKETAKRDLGFYRRRFPRTFTTETAYLSIELQNLSPTSPKDLRVSYESDAYDFDEPAEKKSDSSEKPETAKKLVSCGRGH